MGEKRRPVYQDAFGGVAVVMIELAILIALSLIALLISIVVAWVF